MQVGLDRDAQSQLNDDRLAVIAEHGRCERVEDWDGALATMIDEPHYVFYPNRLRARGAAAIMEWWSRTHVFRDLDPRAVSRVIDRETFFSDNAIGLLKDVKELGPLFVTVFAAFHFDGLKIVSETVFFDRDVSRDVDQVLESREFLAVPGVERF